MSNLEEVALVIQPQKQGGVMAGLHSLCVEEQQSKSPPCTPLQNPFLQTNTALGKQLVEITRGFGCWRQLAFIFLTPCTKWIVIFHPLRTPGFVHCRWHNSF